VNRPISTLPQQPLHMAQLIPADRLQRMPWKNGGGSTTEVTVHPAGASLADFAWRLSLADVESDGPFSLFPGVDRILMLVEGAGVRLDIGSDVIELREQYGVCAFRGDDAVNATLVDGAVRDCNLMVRRPGRGRLQAVHGRSIAVDFASFRVCHALRGVIGVRAGHAPVMSMPAGWTLVLDATDAQLPLVVDAGGPDAVAIVGVIDEAHGAVGQGGH
jgi:environmental stress-induced protein Ves